AAALPIATLRAMNGPASAGRASLAMVRLRPGVDVDRERAALEAQLRTVTVISTSEALKQVDERLSYFRQLAVILGAVSLVVGFLLVTTLVTVSVNERIGEISVMRAIGVRRWRVVAQILLESSVIMLVATPVGLALGLVTARWLNSIAGERVDRLSDARATDFRLRRIGFVFQRFYLMQALTARENVELPLAEAGMAGTERRDRALDLLDYVGLRKRERHRPSQLSGGEQQRVAIARALANRPALLLADEPTGELDAYTGAEMIALFERLNADGTTIVVVTH